MQRKKRNDGEPGTEDQFKRGASATDPVAGEEEAKASAPSDAGEPEVEPEAVEEPAAEPAPAAERLLEEQRDKYLRLAAEYDNYRKRSVKERQEAGSRAQAELAKQLLDALDDLSRFAHVDPASADASTVVQGAGMVEQKLLKALGAAGLQVINPVDQTFDPNVMEAVATEPALSPEDDDTVGKVYQPGYLFAGQLLRPARVVVKQWNG